MQRHSPLCLLLSAVLATALLVPISAGTAHADGLPVINLDTSRTGISSPDGSSRYYALPARGRTELIEIRAERLRSLRSMDLAGTLAVPGVAFDGTTSGLSADGGTLVLIEPRTSFPRRNTRLVVVDTHRWKISRRVDLAGDFSFDAISPDGSAVYFIHYLDRRDPTKYEVRAYDTTAGEMRAEPVIDSRTAPVVMRGFPMTRATSPDGVWEYTLYDGAGKTPFVHALNTEEASAVCINLPQLEEARNLTKVDLDVSADGATVDVLSGLKGERVAQISTGSWDVLEPSSAGVIATDGDGGFGAWWALPIFGLGLLAFGLLGRRFRQRRSAQLPSDPLPDTPGPKPDDSTGEARGRSEEQGVR